MTKIGKNIIENLTTGMYENLLIVYREYVQNSADAIDRAIREGLVDEHEAEITIQISPEGRKRDILISDNGLGIAEHDFNRIMLSIADSEKEKSKDKGFRGIGRLGGISSCSKLRFSTSRKGESKKSICTWDAWKVREILNDASQNPSAEELVNSVTSFETEAYETDKHFFLVELIDVEEFADELLDVENVRTYLSTVAPLPYQDNFFLKSIILDYAAEHGFKIDAYQIFVNGERLFKLYTSRIYKTENGTRKCIDELIDIQPFIFEDNDGNVLAWMWLGICSFEKQIPSENLMRGIRLRKENIQIGDELTFTSHHFFKEPRGCLYFIGEVFAVHHDLIPNARRDYFNANDTCKLFEEKLYPFFYEKLYKLYHSSSEYRSKLRDIEKYTAAKESIKTTQFVDKDEEEAKIKQLKELKIKHDAAVKKIDYIERNDENDILLKTIHASIKKKNTSQSDDVNEKFFSQPEKKIEKSKKSVAKPSVSSSDEEQKQRKNKYLTQDLSQFTKKEQKLISRIYTIIKSILPPDKSGLIINKIQEELKK